MLLMVLEHKAWGHHLCCAADVALRYCGEHHPLHWGTAEILCRTALLCREREREERERDERGEIKVFFLNKNYLVIADVVHKHFMLF